jgi:hypothetical protein
MVTILKRRAGLTLVLAVFMLTATPRARAEVIKSRAVTRAPLSARISTSIIRMKVRRP